jgi:type II secretory pathway component GspD/PulD (secretin)
MKKLVTATLILTLSALLTAPCTAQEELKKLLETRKVTVNFNDTPLGDIVDFLTDISTRPWLVDQKSDLSEKPVTLLLKDVTMLEFLDKLCKKVE